MSSEYSFGPSAAIESVYLIDSGTYPAPRQTAAASFTESVYLFDAHPIVTEDNKRAKDNNGSSVETCDTAVEASASAENTCTTAIETDVDPDVATACETDECDSQRILCKTPDGKNFLVPIADLRGCHLYDDLIRDCGVDAVLSQGLLSTGDVTEPVFLKIVEWLREHRGVPDPVVHVDELTRQRKRVPRTPYEQTFLDSQTPEQLYDLLLAANYLGLTSLFVLGCQKVAEWIEIYSPDELRELFGQDDDLSDAEKRRIRRRNVWCPY
ncbi:scf complex subunit skp1 [Aphelenchoides avenae]|nr:scf complex subunit skp1 [Aphelenchus avenae]